jgi:hypothetical protein
VTTTARVSTGWSLPVASAGGPDRTGGATPSVWIGAPSAGGLTLPDATPSATNLYAPRAVWLDDQALIVADTGNHRVMIWREPSLPISHTPADVVLGQRSWCDEGPQAGGRGPEQGMHLPTGVLVHEGRLIVADAWNHRLLVWNEVPARTGTPPDAVIGQRDLFGTEPNAGEGCHPGAFYWPFGLAMIDGDLWVADTGNRRVLAFDGVPEPGAVAAVVLGQPDGSSRDENGGGIGPATFRWPHAIARLGDGIVIADAGNHRLLAWCRTPSTQRAADMVFGQPDFTSAVEVPYAPQSAATLRFPYCVVTADHPSGAAMLVADTGNNRVLWWSEAPAASNAPADGVLAQFDFAATGDNRWDVVAPDTLCWPYGLAMHGRRLAVADSGNNRVMLWDWPALEGRP